MEYLPALRQSLEQTETVLTETDSPLRVASAVARALQRLLPALPLHACRLTHPSPTLQAVDRNGHDHPEWHAVLEASLTREQRQGTQVSPQIIPLPAEIALAGHSLAVYRVEHAGETQAVLFAGLPDKLPAELSASFRDALHVYGDWLAARLALKQERCQQKRQLQSFVELEELADLAALAGPVAHEFNNFLNTLNLQMMVLVNQIPEQFRSDLRSISQQAKSMASLVRQWQQHRAQQRPTPQRFQLNDIVKEVVDSLTQATAERAKPLVLSRHGQSDSLSANALAVKLSLAADLPLIEVVPLDLRLVLRLLITNAANAINTHPGYVMITTANENGMVLLSVEDSGPPVVAALLPQLFDLTTETREGTSQLEMAACEALVQRRLRGRIQGENRTEGGLAIRVRLRPAS